MKTTIQKFQNNNFIGLDKKIMLTLLLALWTSVFFAQSAFDKYDGQDDVTSVILNKKTFEMLGDMKLDLNKEAGKYIKQVKNIDNFKMFSTSNIKVSEDMKKTFDQYRKQEKLEQLMSIKDDGESVNIYVKSDGKSSNIKEFLMFVEGGNSKGDETVLLSLTGDFDVAGINDSK